MYLSFKAQVAQDESSKVLLGNRMMQFVTRYPVQHQLSVFCSFLGFSLQYHNKAFSRPHVQGHRSFVLWAELALSEEYSLSDIASVLNTDIYKKKKEKNPSVQ